LAQQGPNPIGLLEGAVQQMLPILGGVKPDQLSGSAPCAEWSVQQLITHNIKAADFVHSTILGNNITNPWGVDGPLPSQGARAAFVAGTTRELDLLKSINDLN